MSTDTFAGEKSYHAQLPLLVNGRLGDADAAALRAAIARDPALQAEEKLLRELRQTMKEDPLPLPGEFGLAKVKRALRRERRDASPWWRRAAVAAAALLMLQSGYLALHYETLRGDTLKVQLLGESGGSAAPLYLVFQESVSLGELQALLEAIDAEIVAGPNSLGVFTLAFTSVEARQAGLEALQGSALVAHLVHSEPESAAP